MALSSCQLNPSRKALWSCRPSLQVEAMPLLPLAGAPVSGLRVSDLFLFGASCVY